MSHEFLSEFEESKRIWALSAYVNASRILIRAKTIKDLINGVCEGVTRQHPYILASVGLAKPGSDKTFEFVGSAGSALRYLEGLTLSWDENSEFGQGPTGVSVRSRKSVVCSDVEIANNYGSWIHKARECGIRSSISIPFYENEEPLGIFIIYADQPNAFGSAEIELFETLAEELSYGILNIKKQALLEIEINKKLKLQKELLENFELTIAAIASTLEFRDPYTAGHQKRVANIAVAIAKELGLTDEVVETVKLASFVHDIGKVSIPFEYLTKPTKLSTLEMEIIKEHAEKGFEILKDIPFPLPIANIVRQHHERIDGSGYPLGLKGDEICFGAKILAVADVIESMATDRPYRFSPGLENSVIEITNNAGRLYDMEVAKAVESLHRKGLLKTVANQNAKSASDSE